MVVILEDYSKCLRITNIFGCLGRQIQSGKHQFCHFDHINIAFGILISFSYISISFFNITISFLVDLIIFFNEFEHQLHRFLIPCYSFNPIIWFFFSCDDDIERGRESSISTLWIFNTVSKSFQMVQMLHLEYDVVHVWHIVLGLGFVSDLTGLILNDHMS